MRVTDRSNIQLILSNVQFARKNESEAFLKLSSGKEIVRLRDGPAAASAINTSVSTIRRMEARIDRAYSVEARLAVYDTGLQGATNVLTRAKELAVQLGSDTFNTEDRAAAVEEIEGLKSTLLAIANSQVSGEYIFAGNATTAAAYDTAGDYQGDDEVRSVDLGTGQNFSINLTGPEIFGADAGTDLFDAFDDFVTALEADDGADIRDMIATFDTGINQVTQGLTRVGGREAMVSTLRQIAEDQMLTESESLSTVRDVDLAAAASQLTAAQTAVQAALTTASRVTQFSLMDLL